MIPKDFFILRIYRFLFKRKVFPLALILLLSCYPVCQAQRPASIMEYDKMFTTYPFSDPDPIANPSSKIYPYFHYDGFTNKPLRKEWKVIELENDFIKLTILPQVGGKIWSAIEKSTGKSFIYENHVIKFRDVAMRGPWTSGGIEANYGIFGHTPNCATPVDYTTFKKDDGSVSCVIGALDLLTGTTWRLEINLPADKAYFTTTSFWYNPTPLEQPYYSWMNTGIKTKGNLQFIYPGTHYLGHAGEYSGWPINQLNGKDISFYENNNFGGYKSYHVFGKYSDFFGAYWHDEDFGMCRYSSHDDKAGKKIWIWGLSQQGMIWKNLLTDTDGQYAEVQSGRLFNQSDENSSFTPFKHRGFSAYSSDLWTEYWFPVKQTKGFVKANNYGAINIKRENGWLKIFFCPLQNINDTLKVLEGNKILYSKKVRLTTMHVFADSFLIQANILKLMAVLGENKLVYESDPEADILNRPVESPVNFDWNSVFGLYLQGKEAIRQRFYPRAEENLRACLAKDSNYLPALIEWASLQYRNLQYTDALSTIKKALSIDTYDPAANFNYGLANTKLGKMADAKDGFDLASLSMEYRSAAFIELSKIYFRENQYTKALEYAEKSLAYNQVSLEAYQVEAIIHRFQNDETKADAVLNKMMAIDPLNHFARFEKYLWHSSPTTEKLFTSCIKNEMPFETFLELGICYFQLSCKEDALKVFSLAPPGSEISYWKSFLGNTPVPDTDVFLPISGFPYRAATAEILEELIKNNKDWKLKYQLALIWWSRNNLLKAKELFDACGDDPSYAPFYAAKAALFTAETETSLKKAIELDKEQWRYCKLLVEFYISKEDYQKALTVAESFYKRHPGNYVMGMLNAKTLLLNKQYALSDALLTRLTIIPFEGATDGRQLYHEAKLMQAITEMKGRRFKIALQFIISAKIWPDNLGVGKPYPADTDERLEDWLLYECYANLHEAEKAKRALQRIITFVPKTENTINNFLPANILVTAWALEAMNKKKEAIQLLDQWQQKNPANQMAIWCKQAFESGQSAIPPGITKDETLRILAELIKLKL
jgi:tetratricopeptide (TPR) repeat protein